jgi:predicted nucleotidyltransferase
VKIVVIPDIESVNFGRGVGYEVNEFIPTAAVESISATKIRNSLQNKTEEWTEMVPAGVQSYLRKEK